MSDKKNVFLDVDGTIVTYDNVLPASRTSSSCCATAASSIATTSTR